MYSFVFVLQIFFRKGLSFADRLDTPRPRIYLVTVDGRDLSPEEAHRLCFVQLSINFFLLFASRKLIFGLDPYPSPDATRRDQFTSPCHRLCLTLSFVFAPVAITSKNRKRIDSRHKGGDTTILML
jgi:hypothetical protein